MLSLNKHLFVSIRVTETRDLRAEMREQAVRVMRAWREGLTAWHDHPALPLAPPEPRPPVFPYHPPTKI